MIHDVGEILNPWPDDAVARISFERVRVLSWTCTHCGAANQTRQRKGQRRDLGHFDYIAGKCGRCHQSARLLLLRDGKRLTIPPTW